MRARGRIPLYICPFRGPEWSCFGGLFDLLAGTFRFTAASQLSNSERSQSRQRTCTWGPRGSASPPSTAIHGQSSFLLFSPPFFPSFFSSVFFSLFFPLCFSSFFSKKKLTGGMRKVLCSVSATQLSWQDSKGEWGSPRHVRNATCRYISAWGLRFKQESRVSTFCDCPLF